MKYAIFPILALFIGLALSFQSCQYKWIEYDEVVIPDTVSFSKDVVPLFEASCNTSVCHGGGKDPDLRPDNAYVSLMTGGYVNVSDPPGSSLYTCLLTGGSMVNYSQPGYPDIILGWIEQGALDN